MLKDKDHQHQHILPDGTIIAHNHHHSHTQTKAVLARLSKLIGHLESIKNMVEMERDCSEILIQLAAVRSATNGVSKLILKDHIAHCIVDAVKHNDTKTLDDLNKAIDQFIK